MGLRRWLRYIWWFWNDTILWRYMWWYSIW